MTGVMREENLPVEYREFVPAPISVDTGAVLQDLY